MKTCFGRCARAVVAALSVVFLSRAEADSAAPAITLRPAAGRVWQTCLKPSEPIKWPWIDGATAARLTVESLCDGKSSVITVEREDASLYGTSVWPERPEESERLYDLTLEYMDGNEVLSTETARVALLPGAAGGAFTIQNPNSTRWQKVKVEHPMFAYDADWAEDEVETVSLGQSVGGAAAETRDLDGTSGYDVADTSGSLTTALSLLYDGVEAFTGACRYVGGGLLLLFR